MKKNIILGGDFGTNGLKLLAYDIDADKLVSSSYQPYDIFVPVVDAAEHEPEQYWTALLQAIRVCKREGGFDKENVAAVCFSCHVPVVLPVDENGNVLHRAMFWADNRGKKQCIQQNRDFCEYLRDKNPIGIRTYHYITKMAWFQENCPDLYEKADCFLQCNGYINFRLTGKYSIDQSVAPSLHYYNIHTYSWDKDICRTLGMDINKLPPLYDCDQVVGTILPSVASEVGLLPDTLVIAGAADSSSAPLGIGCLDDGDVCISTGTASSIVAVTDCTKRAFQTDPRLIALGHTLPKRLLNIAVVGNTGGSLKWMRDVLCKEDRIVADGLKRDVFDLMCEQAALSAPTADGLLYFPYTMGELCPFWNPDARGVFFGLSNTTHKRDMIRSVIEGTCYCLRQNIDILRSVCRIADGQEIMITGGPATSPFWMQTLADVTNLPITVLENSLGAPYGDVILAGVGAGIYPDQSSVAREHVKRRCTYQPNTASKAQYDKAFAVYDDMSQIIQEYFVRLAGVRV